MSSRRGPGTWLDDIATAVGSRRIAGGCPDCDAYQTLTKRNYGVFSVTVHHDPGCPWLAGRTL